MPSHVDVSMLRVSLLSFLNIATISLRFPGTKVIRCTFSQKKKK